MARKSTKMTPGRPKSGRGTKQEHGGTKDAGKKPSDRFDVTRGDSDPAYDDIEQEKTHTKH